MPCPGPQKVATLLRKLLSIRPPASYSLAASEIQRRLHFPLDTATVHCLHPNGDISLLRSKPSNDTKPLLLLHYPASP